MTMQARLEGVSPTPQGILADGPTVTIAGFGEALAEQAEKSGGGWGRGVSNRASFQSGGSTSRQTRREGHAAGLS